MLNPMMRFAVAACLVILPGCGRAEPPLVLADLDGGPVPVLPVTRTSVFVFIAPDCPISNRYAPEIARLRDRFSATTAFRVVYPGARVTAERARTHRAEYLKGTPAVLDPDLRLARATGARTTPEAVVLTPDRGMVYRGRIDDLFVDYGVQRPEPSTRDLQAAIDAALSGSAVPISRAPAVGCRISD